MTPLRQRMIQDMQLRGFSARTQECYAASVRQLAAHYHTSPDQLGADAPAPVAHPALDPPAPAEEASGELLEGFFDFNDVFQRLLLARPLAGRGRFVFSPRMFVQDTDSETGHLSPWVKSAVDGAHTNADGNALQ